MIPKLSHRVTECQACGSTELVKVLSLGYAPPVNLMNRMDSPLPIEEPRFATDLLLCQACELVQLGCIVDPEVVFPPDYPYTSGTTRLLRDNFEDLADVSGMLKPNKGFVVDIGSNDGTLLQAFKKRGWNVYGVEPSNVAQIAAARDIPTQQAFFTKGVGVDIATRMGMADVVTCCNCFAHVHHIHDFLAGVAVMMKKDAVFITESHYLFDLLERVQYDTIYHEHLRYYSMTSLRRLFKMHNMEIVAAQRIPTHGGSIRVVAAFKDAVRPYVTSMETVWNEPTANRLMEKLAEFEVRVRHSKAMLLGLLSIEALAGTPVVGISAPSRSSTLVNYCGLDPSLVQYVCEIEGSLKIGRYMPGTSIPVVDESRLFRDRPSAALIFSWHIADEIAANLRKKGYEGKFMVPLPEPKVLDV